MLIEYRMQLALAQQQQVSTRDGASEAELLAYLEQVERARKRVRIIEVAASATMSVHSMARAIKRTILSLRPIELLPIEAESKPPHLTLVYFPPPDAPGITAVDISISMRLGMHAIAIPGVCMVAQASHCSGVLRSAASVVASCLEARGRGLWPQSRARAEAESYQYIRPIPFVPQMAAAPIAPPIRTATGHRLSYEAETGTRSEQQNQTGHRLATENGKQ